MAAKSQYERNARSLGYRLVAGVDEVGRGALFGPVFAAAVILPIDRPIRGLRDSKVLTRERRETLSARIRERAIAWAVGSVDAFEIDRINILQASRLAMRQAVLKLAPLPDYLLVDAVSVDVTIDQEAIIHGDAVSQCIAAASIVAKVERDACMREWDSIFPQYGLKNHKGYSTPEHWKALESHGPTTLHRFSFCPVRESAAGCL
jgi:ribonuclease HII